MHLSIHQDNAVQNQVIPIKHEIILDTRELKDQINTLRLCRQDLIGLMTLHTIHSDILTGKQIQTGNGCIISLSTIV